MHDGEAFTRVVAYVAAGLAFASAATTAYWVLGGTALLDTVGGYAEDLARDRSPVALIVGLIVAGAKVAGGCLALALAHAAAGRRFGRSLRAIGALGSLLLIAYGGLLVGAGALVLAGVIHPSGAVDRRALMWHVTVWDLWFLLWGLALALVTWRSRRNVKNL